MTTHDGDASADISGPEFAGAPGKGRRAAVKEYAGEAVTVTWDAARCIHAAKCISQLPAVFDAERRPWIDPSQASAFDVATAVRACPTGALRYAGDIDSEQPASAAGVQVQIDGPYYVRGDVILCDADGTVVLEGETRLALCRCGATGNAPFCDNSHLAVKFANDPTAREDTTGSAGGSSIRIQPDEPGPYHVSGGVRITRPGGEVLAETEEVWLCRCGKSGSKPFCDGSHNSS